MTNEFDFYVIMIAQAIFIGVGTITLIQFWFKDAPDNNYSIFKIIFHYLAFMFVPNLIFIPLYFGLKYFLF